MAQYITPEGGVQTFEPHETSNTPPGVPDPTSQPIGALPEYGTAVPEQGAVVHESTDAAAGDAGTGEPAAEAPVASGDEATPASNEPVPEGAASGVEGAAGVGASEAAPTAGAPEVAATPAAAATAEAVGVDLTQVEGSGKDGTIIKADVVEAKKQQDAWALAQLDYADGGKTTSDDGDGEKLPTSLKTLMTSPPDATPITDTADAPLRTELVQEATGDQTPS